ncbi:NAD(P)/FAD-dependent oxidoreductase [Streptomyces sp. URMC 128]|uniref:NAD(P)/FAD-dependent oxidoreductase n=1 Tax=Streptomyces sp. URMC 128 TaxID=3423404 RepID=UPI003F1B6C37
MKRNENQRRTGPGLRTDPPLMLVMHEDVVLRDRIAEQIRDWSDGSIVAIGMTDRVKSLKRVLKHEARWRRRGGTSLRFAAVLYGSRRTSWYRRRIEKAIRKGGHVEVKAVALPSDTSFNRTPKQGKTLFVDERTARKFQYSVENLFHLWNPNDAELFLEGDKNSDPAKHLQRFLFLHGISYQWKDDGNPRIKADLTGDGDKFDATLGEIYTRLILGRPTYELAHPYDLVIVGAGPAGLSAGNGAGRLGLSTLLIDRARPGGSAAMSINRIENYLGFPGGVTGTRLAKMAVEQLRAVQVDLRPTVTATKIKKDPANSSRYLIEVDGVEGTDRVSAGMILIACGQRPNTLKHPDNQDQELEIPTTADIRYVMEAHMARDVEGMDILIVGGGLTAGRSAFLYKTSGCASVRLVAKNMEMEKELWEVLEREGIQVEYPAEVVHIHDLEDGRIETTVRGKNKKDHRHVADRVHVLIGGVPDVDWVKESTDLNIEIDRENYIKTDVHTDAYQRSVKAAARAGNTPDRPYPFMTSSPGIFAVGDARVLTHRRVGQAVGQGVAAVVAMDKYLQSKDKEHDGCVWERVLSPDPPEEQRPYRRWLEVVAAAGAGSCDLTEDAGSA